MQKKQKWPIVGRTKLLKGEVWVANIDLHFVIDYSITILGLSFYKLKLIDLVRK